ncbi:hypothetical protein Fcan01_26503, partial [Folsomia candida]
MKLLLFEIILLSTIITSQKIKPNFSTDLSTEFSNFIAPFSSCLIVFYDYAETTWISESVPIVRVKLNVSLYTWPDIIGSEEQGQFFALIPNHTSFSEYHPTYLPCTFEFHLFPPIRNAKAINTLTFTEEMMAPLVDIGTSYIGSLAYFTVPFKVSENTFHKILVTDVANPVRWGAWAAPMFHWKRRFYEVTNLQGVLYFLQDGVAKFYFLCEICTPCHAKFIRLHFSNLEELKARIAAHTSIVVDRTWLINHLALHGDDTEVQEKSIQSAVGKGQKYLNFQNYNATSMNLDLVLFKLAFPNATLTGQEPECVTMPLIRDNSDDVKYSKLFAYNFQTSFTSCMSNLPCVIMDLFMGQVLTYKSEGLEFTTCHQKKAENLMGVSDLVTPFDSATWVLTLATCCTLCVTFWIGHLSLGARSSIITAFLLLGWASLLEQSNDWAKNEVKTVSSRRSPAHFAYVLCTTWILAGLVLSTGYKGGYVKRLTVPPNPPTFTNFKELIENRFSVYTIPYDSSVYTDALNSNTTEERKAIYDNWLSLILVFQFLTTAVHSDAKPNRENPISNQMLQRLKNISIISPSYVSTSTENFSFSDLISDCNEPQALASWTDHVNQVDGPFLIGGNDIVLSRIAGLMSSGLADKWYQVSKEKSVETNWIPKFVPIVRVKLKVTHVAWHNINGTEQGEYFTRIENQSSSSSYYHPTYLPCTFEFHLFPPIRNAKTSTTLSFTEKMRVPFVDISTSYIGNLACFTVPFKVSENTFHKILVTDVPNPMRWGAWAGPMFRWKRSFYAATYLFGVRKTIIKTLGVVISGQHCTWRINHLVLNGDDPEVQEKTIQSAVRSDQKYLNFQDYNVADMNLDLILFKLAFPNVTVTGRELTECAVMPLISDNTEHVKYSKLSVFIIPVDGLLFLNRVMRGLRMKKRLNFAAVSQQIFAICTTLILAGLVLSTGYKGGYVKRLTVPPIPPTFTNFEEIIENKFSVYTIPYDASAYIDALNRNHTEEQRAIEPQALASWTDHVGQVHAQLQAKYPQAAISKSLDPIGKLMKGWALFNWGNDIVLSRIAGLMSSGLADKWYQVSKEKSVTEYVKVSKRLRWRWKGLKLGENLGGISILFLVGSGISMVMFGMEILIFWKRRTRISVITETN